MCIFCGRTSQQFQIQDSTALAYDCPSCGRYGVTDIFLSDHTPIEEDIKIKISHLLLERKLQKRDPVLFAGSADVKLGRFVTTNINTFLMAYPKEAIEIIERSLLNLSRTINHPSDKIRIDVRSKELFFTNNISSVLYIIRQLSKQGYTTEITSTPNDIFIESNGWEKISELKKRPYGLFNQAFVAMWFDPSVENYYINGIKKAIESSTPLKSVRVDYVEHNNKICDQIVAEINKSKLLIADFTGDRGGVYFEAGYAQGLGIPVIWTVHKDWVDNLHFDTRQYNHIVYKDEQELYTKLKARIEATIKFMPNKQINTDTTKASFRQIAM